MKNKSDEAFNDSIPTHIAILRSWLSMKSWVMVWLWYLNFLYLVSFFYLERPEALWAAISYIATAPIIALFVIKQRGLTRLSGCIHLPWAIYVVYLGLRLFTDSLGSKLSMTDGSFYYTWMQFIFWSTLVCIAFDIKDIARWYNGEKYRLGTPSAHSMGASKLAKC